MVSTVRVNAVHGRDFHPLTDHMNKGENRDFSAFRFSLHLMLEQVLSNLIFCLMILQKATHKSCTIKLACCSGC